MASIVSLAISLAGVVSSVVLTVMSAVGFSSLSTDLSVILGILSLMLAMLISDRLLVLTVLGHRVEQTYAAVRSPSNLKRWKNATPFDEFTSGCDDVLIVGLTKAGPLTEGTERITRLIKSRCRLRVAILDVSVPSLYELTARSTTHTLQRLSGDYHQFVETVKTVRAGLSAQENKMLMVRTYPWIPTAGVVFAYRGRSLSAQVYFYPYRTDPYDRPSIELFGTDGGDWLAFFRGQYERMWQDIVDRQNDPTV